MTEIYLIRHSQAQGNRYRMMQGSWDGEVTDLGRRQIEALAERFSKIPVDAVYSSDLSRAVLTAEAVARHRKLPIQTRTALRELDVGPWEKCFFGNLLYAQPGLARGFLEDAEHWKMDGAERKTVAVASHGITIRCIMSGITGISLSDREHLPIFQNTAVTKLLWDGSKFQVKYMNDASHLPENAQSSWNPAGDLRDEPFDPERDRGYYEACYADAWRAAHGSLYGYSPDPYYHAAVRHHRIQPGSVLRIYHGEEPVGLVDLDPERAADQGAGWISLLYLKESCRNQGYGIQLLARAIFFYEAQNRSCLRLQVAEENRAACAFYEREGFHRIAEQKTPTGCLLVMERTGMA